MTSPSPRNPIRRVHLIGVCGTGMGSLAGLLASAGYEVRGSDQSVYPPMSTMLRDLGIGLLDGYRAANLDDRPDLVVVGNIATKTNPEAIAAAERGIPFVSMPQAISRLFLEGRHPIVVTGTHGKTTTAALMAWVLTSAGRDPSFLVGGVLRNFNRSYGLGKGEEFVIEGDEYETAFFDKGPKFLHYRPQTAILTSVEFDHAEMYQDLEAVKRAFRGLVALVPESGTLVYCADDPNVRQVVTGARCHAVPYGLGRDGVWRARVCASEAEGMEIEVTRDQDRFGLFRTPLTGLQNVRNILAVVAVAQQRGLGPGEIGAGLASFQGVKRRQEVRGVAGGVVVIDDFAHHPTAVHLTLGGIRDRYRDGRLWAIFEPRTNTTRRSVFQEEYAASFDPADRIVIAAVDHPERAPEGKRFSAEGLVSDLKARGKEAVYIPAVADIVEHVSAEARSGDVVLVMSNGAFGGIHDKLLAALAARGA
ncbi:MAG TPA: UDP-N-acetylmuramate:L-alanyl-gamma-D-glutamyl-meso-diaminopimelate ligase [Candidatus Polarisedimenticolia bacterium]|nr:UDP-N-acetylmuramate:L-alanyl-gamma-D-glutamyl-meso-diaminopimelate ligase [Candidatus Polarisedimenticolia bacterium]